MKCKKPLRGFSSGIGSLFAVLLLAGCAGEQMFATGQAWQRNQCQQMPDDAQRARCLERADTRYEDYRREGDTRRAGS